MCFGPEVITRQSQVDYTSLAGKAAKYWTMTTSLRPWEGEETSPSTDTVIAITHTACPLKSHLQ